MVDSIGGERLKTLYAYVYAINKFGVNDLKITDLKIVYSDKSKFVINDHNTFSIPKKQVKELSFLIPRRTAQSKNWYIRFLVV